jgi:hypothetical protein
VAIITRSTTTITDGLGAAKIVETYVDPNNANASGAIVAVMLSDGSLLAPGQALAANSLPVALPALQVTALTPLPNVGVSGLAASGVAVVGNPVLMGGSDGVNARSVTVFQTHNSDDQLLGASVYAINTGGVAQLVNLGNTVDRQRETGADNVSATGIATGTQQLKSPIATTATAAPAAGASTLTLAGTRFTSSGAAAWIQPGSILTLDPGSTTIQEQVRVATVNYSTGVVTFRGLGTGGANTGVQFTHANGCVVTSASYNEARDATTPEGSSGAGIPLGATTLYNQLLNGGTGGWENERSAAGELDGASGKGTAVATEFQWNGGGPITNTGAITTLAYDRARSLQAKNIGSTTLNGLTVAGGTTLILVAAIGLEPGQQILLDRNTANEEAAYVTSGYTVGSLTVPLSSAMQFGHANSVTVEWDEFGPHGPGLNGFTACGVGIEVAAMFNSGDGKYYGDRSAVVDAMPPANVPAESAVLFNGTAFDRARSVGQADGLGAELAMQPSSTPAAATAAANTSVVQTYGAVAGQQHRLTMVATSFSVAAATTGLLTVTDGGATVFQADVPLAANSPYSVPLPPGGIKGSVNSALVVTLSAAGGTTVGKLNSAKLTA